MSFDKNALSIEKLAEIFAYDPETGKIFWRVKSTDKVRIGTEAGCTKATRTLSDGSKGAYRYVRVLGKSMPAQRVAWALHYGEWPIGKLYFEDGNPLNLCIANLRQSNSVPTQHDHNTAEGKADWNREYRERHPMEWRDSHLRSTFGISLAEYTAMAIAQGGKCAICNGEETHMRGGKVKALAVDHDHETGVIRGLLCAECNQMLGKAKDNRETLLAAVRYLDKHSGRESLKPALTIVSTEDKP